jgi:hypothetical protein
MILKKACSLCTAATRLMEEFNTSFQSCQLSFFLILFEHHHGRACAAFFGISSGKGRDEGVAV